MWALMILFLVNGNKEAPVAFSVPGFATVELCEAAGKAALERFSGTGRVLCVRQSVPAQ